MTRRPVPENPPGTLGLARDAALVPLSRDHHHSLVEALSLRRAAEGPPADARGPASRFLEHYRGPMLGHFADEERCVLPRTAAVDPEGAARIREEHVEITALVVRLEATLAAGGDPRALMRELGQLIDDHVRFEERAHFMTAQERLPAAEMRALGRDLETRRQARGAPGCALPPGGGRDPTGG